MSARVAPGESRERLADVHLVGERVQLRPVRAADAAAAFPLIHCQTAVLQWLVWSGPADEQELAEGYASWVRPSADGVDYLLAILDTAGEFCGSIGPRYRGHPGIADIGYWLAEREWSRGYTSEALGLLCHLCFQHLGSHTAVADVLEGNEASVRVLEKNGFEGTRQVLTRAQPDGGRRRVWMFTLTRRAWERQEARVRPVSERVEFVPLDAE